MTLSVGIVFLTLAICGTLDNASSAKILAVIPFPMKSHNIVYKPLLLELARRGHIVTSITAYPSHKNIKNYNEILFETKAINLTRDADFYEIRRTMTVWNVGWFELFPFWALDKLVLEDIFKTPAVEKLINDKKETFDLVICEGFFGFESLFAFGELFESPTIAVGTFGSSVYIDQYIGAPLELSYFPNFELPYSNQMTFIERAHNLLFNSFILVMNELYHIPEHEQLISTYFGKALASRKEVRTLRQLAADVSLVLLNTHSILGYARPKAPNVINIGGLHIEPLKNSSIDTDLQQLMDNAEQGIIYFSLGSNVNIAKMPEKTKQAFINALSRFPQVVLWKSDNPELSGKPSNVIIRKWFPQQQVLGHKNCKAFITHGGILSLEEAAYYAVPVIGIPFFGDQPMNMRLVSDINFGIHLEYNNLTSESISWALHQVLEDSLYRNKAKSMSKIFRDTDKPPLENAVYWVEYVLRHKGADHLKIQARLLPWYKLLLLDVILAIIVTISLPCVSLYLLLRCTTNRYLRRKCTKIVNNKKKVN